MLKWVSDANDPWTDMSEGLINLVEKDSIDISILLEKLIIYLEFK